MVLVHLIARRIFRSLIIIFVLCAIVFWGLSIVGDPVFMLASPDADQFAIEAVTEELGLDKPLPIQFILFMRNLFQGDLGNSYVFGRPATDLVLDHLPATLELALCALVISVLFGISLGLFCAIRPRNILARSIMAASIVGLSFPSFLVGIFMILIFAVFWGVLPAGGRGDVGPLFGISTSLATWDGLQHVLLPAINLSLIKASLILRVTHASACTIMAENFIIGAKAKGAGTWQLTVSHILPNAIIPVVTILGVEFCNLIAFSAVTEVIFSWPGMGRLLIEGVLALDRPIVVAYLLIVVIIFLVANLVVDLIYYCIDPRIRSTQL